MIGSKNSLSVQGVGANLPQHQVQKNANNSIFDQVLKESDALYNNLQYDEESEEYHVSSEELENLRLGNLVSPVLEQNPVFIMLRGKLVNFYKKLEQYNIDPSSVRIDNLHLKKTLYDSVKKLLRCVIVNDDKSLQMSQLNRLYHWFNAKSDALESKEAATAQKMREEQMQKRKEMKKKVMEQQSMTYFPPIKKGQNAGRHPNMESNKSLALGGKRDTSERTLFLDKTRQSTNNMQFTVSRNTILGGTESAADMNQYSTHKIVKKEESFSPIKASYQSVSVLQQQPSSFNYYSQQIRDGGTGGMHSDNSLSYLTPNQEDELREMLEQMDAKDKEYSKHHETIKRAWLQWGKNKAINGQRAVQVFERAKYASNFERLGASYVKQNRGKSYDPTSSLQDKQKYYYGMTEQQFLQDSSSESELDTADESKSKLNTQVKKQAQIEQKNLKQNKRSYGNSSGEENSQTEELEVRSDLEEDNNYKAYGNDDDYKFNVKKVQPPQPQRSTSTGYYTQKPSKANKIIDLSFEDYQHEMTKTGLGQDLGESFQHRNMSKQAANKLNESYVQAEIQRETTRRRIDQIRWQHNSLINGGQNQQNQEDQIDNPMRAGNEVLTLSIFSRPCNQNNASQIDYANIKPEDNYRQFSITTTKGLFNPKINMENQKRMQAALQEAEKLKIKNPGGGGGKKKPAQSASPKKKGKNEPDEEAPKPKIPTRNDIRILTQLQKPFRAENYDFRTEQMQEVEDLKHHLARNNLNVSADILHKAIVLPEEHDRDEDRHYPKIEEFLFVNPFAKPKKKKKGKKKRR